MSNQLSLGIGLISHTNIGKTTLARTLLRTDVGEVRDEAHVTLESTGYRFISGQSMEVTIWDTPGFGGAIPAKLVKRLKGQDSPLQWLLHQTIDRFTDKPAFSSVEAAKTLAQRCDAALYLVSGLEEPGDAAYVRGELDLIALLGIPVLITINQTGGADRPERDALIRKWQGEYGQHPAVAGVVVFDAYSRYWFEEVGVLRALAPLLPELKQGPFLDLVEKHQRRQMELEHKSMERICAVLRFATHQELAKAQNPNGKKALQKMLAQLQEQIGQYVDQLCDDYNLSKSNSPSLQADLEHLHGMSKNALDEKKTGLLAGALSGASYGIAADAMSGGLSFGGGALVGFVLGGFGGLFAARGINAILAGGDSYRWKEDFLQNLVVNLLMIYLLIAHHGRGKGGIDFTVESETWRLVISKRIEESAGHISMALDEPESCPDVLRHLLSEIFARLFPDVSAE